MSMESISGSRGTLGRCQPPFTMIDLTRRLGSSSKTYLPVM
jgi:hypothetical protein